MRNRKLWLCGMVRGNRAVLEKSISNVIQYFDGAIFVVDSRVSAADLEWLESIKKEGKIIVKKWVNDHAHTSNEVILSGVMEDYDFFAWIDETDQINPVFAKNLRENVEYWYQNNVGMVYLDHPFIVLYHSGIRFSLSPHWFISNTYGNTINLSQINGYRKENYVFNWRNLLQSAFLNPAKYWFCYPPFSNHTQLLYRHFSENIWRQHEQLRIQFRDFCKNTLKIELTLDSLIEYLKTNVGNYPEYFENTLEIEPNVKDIFRLFALNQTTDDLIKNRFDWSYFHWKRTGETSQDPQKTGFIGLYNQYNQSINRPRE